MSTPCSLENKLYQQKEGQYHIFILVFRSLLVLAARALGQARGFPATGALKMYVGDAHSFTFWTCCSDRSGTWGLF